jgi:multicomponent Na+:H+ antiporter subunit G
MSVIVDVVSAVLLLAGTLLALLGALGVVRLRDPLVAMHAATKPATLGVVLTGAGAILQLGDAGSISKVVVVVVVQLATVPVGAHMLGRAMEKSQSDDHPSPPR